MSSWYSPYPAANPLCNTSPLKNTTASIVSVQTTNSYLSNCWVEQSKASSSLIPIPRAILPLYQSKSRILKNKWYTTSVGASPTTSISLRTRKKFKNKSSSKTLTRRKSAFTKIQKKTKKSTQAKNWWIPSTKNSTILSSSNTNLNKLPL